MTHETILTHHNHIPHDDPPQERLFRFGCDVLSTAELLALVLQAQSSDEESLQLAERILTLVGGLSALSNTTPDEFLQIQGMSSAKAAQLAAALELGRRIVAVAPIERQQITQAKMAAHLLMDMASLAQEQIRLILLDSNQRVMTISTVYIGTVDTSIVRVAEIFREAIIRNSPAVILAHNHPSGDPQPSPEDIALTRTLLSAGQLLDIQVLDHIIIGDNRWKSLRELGLVFTD